MDSLDDSLRTLNSYDEILKFLASYDSLNPKARVEDRESAKCMKVIQFINNPKGAKVTFDHVNNLIGNMNLKSRTSGHEEMGIVKHFLINKDRPTVSSGEFIKAITSYTNLMNPDHPSNEFRRAQLINTFLEAENTEDVTSDKVSEMIKNFIIQDAEKLKIIKSFVKNKNNLTFDQVSEMIENNQIQNANEKLTIIQFFLANKNRGNLTFENVRNIATKLETIDSKSKCDFLTTFFQSKDGKDVAIDNFAEIIKLFGLNEIDFVRNLHKNLFSQKNFPPEENVKNLIKIIQELQPSETMQCIFLEEFITSDGVETNPLKYFKPFINELKDNTNVSSILDTLTLCSEEIPEKNILDLLGSRVRKQYSFLTEIVDGKNLEECIETTGITSLRTIFGEDLKIEENPITVSDLFAYYDFINQTLILSAMLKPEFKEQLRDNFSPSAEMLLYKPAELDKLNQLLHDGVVAFDSKNYFVENAKLCEYLKEKVGDISEIDSSKTYQINFVNFGIEEEEKAEINTLFNELLKSPNPNKERVAKFFSDLLGIAFSDNDGDKLTTFFQQNKKELAHCFCDKELSKENFETLFTTIRDGCFANIDMQFKNMLYGMMIKDEQARILYDVADTQIFSAIANGQDFTHEGSSINNKIINSYFLSPMRLIEKLSNEEKLNSQKATDIIKKNIGEDKFINLHERLSNKLDSNLSMEDKGKIMEKKAKEIASYLIVKEVFGEIKMRDLESKNPQLKELSDFLIYNGVPEPSPRISQENGQSPSKRQRR